MHRANTRSLLISLFFLVTLPTPSNGSTHELARLASSLEQLATEQFSQFLETAQGRITALIDRSKQVAQDHQNKRAEYGELEPGIGAQPWLELLNQFKTVLAQKALSDEEHNTLKEMSNRAIATLKSWDTTNLGAIEGIGNEKLIEVTKSLATLALTTDAINEAIAALEALFETFAKADGTYLEKERKLQTFINEQRERLKKLKNTSNTVKEDRNEQKSKEYALDAGIAGNIWTRFLNDIEKLITKKTLKISNAEQINNLKKDVPDLTKGLAEWTNEDLGTYSKNPIPKKMLDGFTSHFKKLNDTNKESITTSIDQLEALFKQFLEADVDYKKKKAEGTKKLGVFDELKTGISNINEFFKNKKKVGKTALDAQFEYYFYSLMASGFTTPELKNLPDLVNKFATQKTKAALKELREKLTEEVFPLWEKHLNKLYDDEKKYRGQDEKIINEAIEKAQKEEGEEKKYLITLLTNIKETKDMGPINILQPDIWKTTLETKKKLILTQLDKSALEEGQQKEVISLMKYLCDYLNFANSIIFNKYKTKKQREEFIDPYEKTVTELLKDKPQETIKITDYTSQFQALVWNDLTAAKTVFQTHNFQNYTKAMDDCLFADVYLEKNEFEKQSAKKKK